jgi:hypothetical protein
MEKQEKQRKPSNMAVRYAVSVNRNDGNYLLSRIIRTPQGDIYVPYRLAGVPKQWKPHLSIHGDGKAHYKDWKEESLNRWLPPPDQSFRGTVNITNLAVGPEEGRGLTQRFNLGEFSDFFEIDIQDLKTGEVSTQIALDVVEPGKQPALVQGRIIRQKTFCDREPWIVATLIELGP